MHENTLLASTKSVIPVTLKQNVARSGKMDGVVSDLNHRLHMSYELKTYG